MTKEQLVNICDRVIRFSFCLIFGLVPLLLTPWNYELFEFNKMLAVYGLTLVITTAWLIKMVAAGEVRIVRTPLDIPIALFVASQLISSLFSIDRHVSWFGYYSRFNGGMWSVISYVVLYYALISNLSNWSSLTNLLRVALSTAAVVAGYGVLERLGIDKHLWVQDVQNRVFSTLGQPNWLAAYLAALVPISWALGLKFKIEKQKNNWFPWIAYYFISLLFFTVLLFTRSRSGLIGFAVADVVFLILARFNLTRLKDRTINGLVFLHFLFLIILFFIGTSIPSIDKFITLQGWQSRSATPSTATPSATVNRPPSNAYTAPLLEYGGTESSKIRKYVWTGALAAWQGSIKNLLIGTGTETFAWAFFQYRPAAHNLTSEWDFLYNKAHNEYLNYLATTGIFGLGSYLLLIGAFIYWFIKFKILNLKLKIENNYQELLLYGLFSGWVSLLVTNFFGFSVVTQQLFFFLFPAIIFVISQQHSNQAMKQFVWHLKMPKLTMVVPLIISISLLISLINYWWGDTLFAGGYRASHAGSYEQARAKLTAAISRNSGEPGYHDELSQILASLAVAKLEAKDASGAGNLAKLSFAESDRALSISPNNVNFWKTRTKIFYAFTDIDEAFLAAATQALERARQLSPNDPKIYYNLAVLEGKRGKNDKAIELLQKSVELKPNHRDAFYALYVFYQEVKKPDEARDILKQYLETVDPGDQEFLTLIKK